MDKKLFAAAMVKFFSGLLLMGLLLFLPAGTFAWPEGWLLMGILFVPMFMAGLVMMAKDPELLRRRLNAKEEQAEQKRVEQDFNLKYEEFLEGQRDFPETILRKRQTELKELLDRNVSFKAKGRQELAEAEVKAMAPLRKRLEAALSKIGRERGYAFILNTDAGAVPFINPDMGDDINQLVKDAFK